MATVRTHRGRLLIDYRVDGQRVRHYTKLVDSGPNRMRLMRVAEAIDAALSEGTPIEVILAAAGLIQPTSQPSTSQAAQVPWINPVRSSADDAQLAITSPLFCEFAERWYAEFSISWRRTYAKTVRGIVDKYLIPAFGNKAISTVKAELEPSIRKTSSW